MKGAHVLVRGADKPELQAQQCRGALRLNAQLPDGVHDVPVLEGQGLAAAQVLGCRGQIVHQPQQLVVALVQQGRPGVQLRVLLPLGGRHQLRRRQAQVAQGAPQLGGDIGKQKRLLALVLFHGGSFPAPEARWV